MEGILTEDLHGFQRICGSRNFCKVFEFMLIFLHSSRFSKEICVPRKGEEPFFCHKFSRRERKRKSVRKRQNSVYKREERTGQKFSEWKNTYNLVPPFVLRSHTPWLALANPSGCSSRRPNTQVFTLYRSSMQNFQVNPHPLQKQEPGH